MKQIYLCAMQKGMDGDTTKNKEYVLSFTTVEYHVRICSWDFFFFFFTL